MRAESGFHKFPQEYNVFYLIIYIPNIGDEFIYLKVFNYYNISRMHHFKFSFNFFPFIYGVQVLLLFYIYLIYSIHIYIMFIYISYILYMNIYIFKYIYVCVFINFNGTINIERNLVQTSNFRKCFFCSSKYLFQVTKLAVNLQIKRKSECHCFRNLNYWISVFHWSRTMSNKTSSRTYFSLCS